MPGPNQITPAQLSRLIGTPDAPAIVDVRIPEDIAADPRLVPGAFTLPHGAADPAPDRLRGRRVVVVCQRGLKLSEGVAALLRAQGIAAEVLAGGSLAWAAAGLPMVPLAALPPRPLWVTRHRPRIDRIACPWLIRRFVDPAARFLFVAPSEVQAVADRFGATAFDIPGTHWSHRGDLCTFDVMLSEFGLSTPALDRLALVVRGADTNRHDLAPQAAGLLALSVGLSRMFRDDLAQLEAGMTIYDALYRWARDGADEGHDWQAAPVAGGQA
jgi:rhodanese-related sulfurtransferase